MGLSEEVAAQRIGKSRRWWLDLENGRISPRQRELEIIANLLRTTTGALTGEEAGRLASVHNPDDASGDVLDLLAVVDGTDVGHGVISNLEGAVLRLRRSYSTTPPRVLGEQLAAYLATVQRLLRGRLMLTQRRDVMAQAGWLALLYGTVWLDRAVTVRAWNYRNAALHTAQELGHTELEAWAWETPAWFALMEGRFRDAAEFCERGRAVAPQSSVLVALNAQEARARGRLGQRDETIAAIQRAERVIERIPPPEDLSDHYTFDPAKVDFYAATAFLALDEPERAEYHARNVIAASSDAGSPNYWPTRVGSARMDLSLALAQRHEIDAAGYEANLAFEGPFVRLSTLVRAQAVMRALAPYRDVAEVRDFSGRLDEAVRAARPA